MSISEREQETLFSIESDLIRSSPKLASMLAMFARLTADEQMPAAERIRWPALGRPAGRAGARSQVGQDVLAGARRMPGRLGIGVWRLLWLVIVIAVIVCSLAFEHGAGKRTCTVSRTAACAQVPGHGSASSLSGAGLGL